MGGWADSNWLRAAGYLAVAVTCCLGGLRERRNDRDRSILWPSFWFLTAGVFLAMGLGRLSDFGDLLTALGRQEAVQSGWYANRRKYQAMAVGALCAIWFVTVLISLWRVPERRRRYLPMALVTFTVACFAGVRLVSLHGIDGLLYRRQILTMKFATVVELLLIGVALVVSVLSPRMAVLSSKAPPGPDRSTGLDAVRVPTQ